MNDPLMRSLAGASVQTIKAIVMRICTEFPQTRSVAEEVLLADALKTQIEQLNEVPVEYNGRRKMKVEYTGDLDTCTRSRVHFDADQNREEKCTWHQGMLYYLESLADFNCCRREKARSIVPSLGRLGC
jgi:hypothetical protein